jgi:acetoacetyl-CoA reductase
MARVAFVTGGTRGIGRAVVDRLCSDGFKVAAGYSGNEQAAESCRRELKVLTVKGNVGSFEDCRRAAAEVEAELGPIDVLVNNAGITRDDLIMRLSEEDWRDVIDTNLGGAFFTSKSVSRPMLKRRKGTIVNISSIVGVHGNAGQSNYAASKAGLIGLTKALAKELGGRGIRVNAIAPGYIATELTDALPDQARDAILANTPLGRLGDPADVARAVRFLASDAAAFVTGDVLAVDGGLGI